MHGGESQRWSPIPSFQKQQILLLGWANWLARLELGAGSGNRTLKVGSLPFAFGENGLYCMYE